MKGSRSPGHCKQTRLAGRLKFWFIQMRAGIYTGGYQGLPQTGMTPLVHYGAAIARHTSWVHGYYGMQCNKPNVLTYTNM